MWKFEIFESIWNTSFKSKQIFVIVHEKKIKTVMMWELSFIASGNANGITTLEDSLVKEKVGD